MKKDIKNNCIYNLDVINFLNNKVDDNSVDLAVIDPPYNMKKADWDTFKAFIRLSNIVKIKGWLSFSKK
jgi:site-specific DNA-methyltransferase (adenine-specific)